jgi:hypothetical protein
MGNLSMDIGSRVAIISKLDTFKHKCYFIGYGIFSDRCLIPFNKNLNRDGKKLSKLNGLHCKFITDDNKIFYDYECWIISEERFKKVFIEDEYKEGWKVIRVNRKSKH